MLQVEKGDTTHQRVPMQSGPRSPLEGTEPKLLLELLVRLLADPACLDSCRKPEQRRVRRQVAQVVFPLAAASPFADEPDLFPRQVAVARIARSVGDPHAQGRETSGQCSFAASTPSDTAPSAGSQHVCAVLCLLAWHGVQARLSSTRTRKQQLDGGGEHLLRARHAHRPDETTCTQALAERRAETIACIGQDAAKAVVPLVVV